MPARKKTPDLMNELLTGKSASQRDRKPVKQYDSMTASQHTSKTVKATYYLPEELLFQLQEKQIQLRRQGKKVSLSWLVGEAIKEYLNKEV